MVDAPERKKSQMPIGQKLCSLNCSEMEKVTIFCDPVEEEPQEADNATKAPNVTDESDGVDGGNDDEADGADIADATKAAADPAGDVSASQMLEKRSYPFSEGGPKKNCKKQENREELGYSVWHLSKSIDSDMAHDT